MSYFKNIDYSILKSAGDDFNGMLNEILQKMDSGYKILRLVFFSAVADDDDYRDKLNSLRIRVGELFKGKLPVISLVPQKPLDAGLVVEVHSYRPDPDESLIYKDFNGFPYVVLENRYGRFLYAGGLHSSSGDDISAGSVGIFNVLGNILRGEGFNVDSIVRQWNYIGNITSFDDSGNQHYQMFNNARTDFYSSWVWSDGYPAATGIGTSGQSVVVDADAVMLKCADFEIRPIDNKLQIAAHAYSENVLEKADTGLTTPKFERAKSLGYGNERMVYVSGTAAIRGEKSITDDVVEQLHVTMENIRQLTGDSEIKLLRIYLKNEEDYEVVHQIMAEYQNISQSYLLADVCRDELLIEIEGVAIDCR